MGHALLGTLEDAGASANKSHPANKEHPVKAHDVVPHVKARAAGFKGGKLETMKHTWKAEMGEAYPNLYVPPLNGKEIGLLKQFVASCPSEDVAPDLLTAIIRNWPKAVARAEKEAGAWKAPSMPDLQWIMRFKAAMLNFALNPNPEAAVVQKIEADIAKEAAKQASAKLVQAPAMQTIASEPKPSPEPEMPAPKPTAHEPVKFKNSKEFLAFIESLPTKTGAKS
jgi:hypothetical protein